MKRKVDASPRYERLLNSADCSHDQPCPGESGHWADVIKCSGHEKTDAEIIKSLMESFHAQLEGLLKSITLFVDEMVVFKIDMMSTNFGRSLINQ